MESGLQHTEWEQEPEISQLLLDVENKTYLVVNKSCIGLVCTSGVKCPLLGNMANGRITPSPSQMGDYLYRDYIFVRCDPGYKLMKVRQHKVQFSKYRPRRKWFTDCCGS